MPELSVLIPARQEIFLARTIKDILSHIEGDTEIIAVCDGYWPDPVIEDHPRVHLVHHSVAVGQRQATNEAASLSRSEFIMKCDAHCAFDQGFDVKLIAPYKDGRLGPDVTTIPRMFNLHAFDWKCTKCTFQTYQGPKPTVCPDCHAATPFERVEVWRARTNRRTDFARFDHNLHFQYWKQYERRPEAKPDLADVLCHVGAGWFMPRQRYLDLGGLDEKHGSWGQMGVEISLKSWLSGGRQVVNKNTWYSHMFRTQKDFSFPYPMHGKDQDAARNYSQWLWLGDGNWPLATRKLSWVLEKFAPVPDWET